MFTAEAAALRKASAIKRCFPAASVWGWSIPVIPWEAGQELHEAVRDLWDRADHLILIANSIGAFYSMYAGIDTMLCKAYFISPIVDMEKLILDMMRRAEVTEKELEERRGIVTSFGEVLSWDYLCYVREHPIRWTAPTAILYGAKDMLTSYETMAAFAREHNASLTVMDSGEHWFHTCAQMAFLDEWIRKEEQFDERETAGK